MAKNPCDEDQSKPEKGKEELSPSICQVQHSLAVRKISCLTFAGFRAAKTVKQLTQEAITSTGGEITVVNLVGEHSTALSKMNNTFGSISNIFQFSPHIPPVCHQDKEGVWSGS
jgi:hypothetical protein